VPLAEQVLAEVGSEEAGAAGNYAGRHGADAIGADGTGVRRVHPAISGNPNWRIVQKGGEKRLWRG
jgi:hypothetical protein